MKKNKNILLISGIASCLLLGAGMLNALSAQSSSSSKEKETSAVTSEKSNPSIPVTSERVHNPNTRPQNDDTESNTANMPVTTEKMQNPNNKTKKKTEPPSATVTSEKTKKPE